MGTRVAMDGRRARRIAFVAALLFGVLAPAALGAQADYTVTNPIPVSGSYPTVLSRDGRTSATVSLNTFVSLSTMKVTDVATHTTSDALTATGTTLMAYMKVLDITGDGRTILFLGDSSLAPGFGAFSLQAAPPILYLYDVQTHVITRLSPKIGTTSVANVANARITPDGSKVVFASPDSLSGQPASTGTYVVYQENVDGTNLRRVADTGLSPLTCSGGYCAPPMPLAVSDDGNIVAFFTRVSLDPADTGLQDLYTKNLATGALRWVSRIPPGAYYGVRYLNGMSADGRVLAFTRDEVTSQSGVWVVNGDDQATNGYSESEILAPDGNHLLYGVLDGALATGYKDSLYVRDLAGGGGRTVAQTGYGGSQDSGYTPIAVNTDASKVIYFKINSGAIAELNPVLDPGPAAPGAQWLDGDVNHDGIVRWAILGDSYISGEGLTKSARDVYGNPITYDAGTDGATNDCHRARTSWAVRLAAEYGATGNNLLFAACSGAVTHNITKTPQYPQSPYGVAGGEPQATTLRNFAANGQVDVVLVSIGGNDAGFVKQITSCLTSVRSACQPQKADLTTTETNVRRALLAIKGAAPGAEVFHSDYPNPVEPPGADCGSVEVLGGLRFHFGISPDEERRAGQFLSNLNQADETADGEAGAHSLHIGHAFADAGICTNSGYMNGLSAGVNDNGISWRSLKPIANESFHPTDAGHAHLLSVIEPEFARLIGTRNPTGTDLQDNTPTVETPQATVTADLDANGTGHLELQYYPVTEQYVTVSTYSLPHLAGTYHAAPGTPLDISIPVPHAPAPGLHEVQVLDANTGEQIASAFYLGAISEDCTKGPDSDGDLLPDACDSDPTDGPLADADHDGISNADDDCPTVADPAQTDSTGDGIGDACNPAAGAPALTGFYAPDAQDTASPHVTGTPDRAPDAAGWYTRPVTISWHADDPAPSSGAVGDPAPTQVATDGAGQTITSDPSCDRAGNCASGQATVSLDSHPPTITGDRSPQAGRSGWDHGPVRVHFDCADALSGVDRCPEDQTLDTETPVDGVSVDGQASDRAGNRADALVGPIRIDLAPPTLTGAPTAAANAAGWYRGDVTIQWQAQDGLSGVDVASVPGDEPITGEGQGLTTPPRSAADVAGNRSEPTVSRTVNIDRTAPQITGGPVSDPDADGWFNGAVRVHFSCSDPLSGVAECPADAVITDDGRDLQVSGSARDAAGNTASLVVGGIDIDSHAPISQARIACDGYCRDSQATVRLDATDPPPSPGIATSGAKSISYQVGDGAVQSAAPGSDVQVALAAGGRMPLRFWAIDRAGNAESPNTATITSDASAPVVTHALLPDPANASGWNHADTTVHFSASDDGSGVDPATVTPDVLVDSETAGRRITGSADDRAGNRGTDTVTVKLDKTPPTVSRSLTGPASANGWYRGPVTATFACADPGAPVASGIATCTGAQTLADGQSVTGTAVDRADNQASVTAGPVRVDADKPLITLTGIQDGGVYTLGAVPAATCTAVDVGPSGLDGACTVTITGGSGAGSHGFSASASDRAGNVATVTGNYTVQGTTTQGLCALTKQYVAGSAKYQRLPLADKYRAGMNTTLTSLCATVDRILPKLGPLQKAVFVALYDAGVKSLVADGWISSQQATTLTALAGSL